MINHSNILQEGEKRNVYFLTEQTDNFRKLLPEKVLGMIEITESERTNKINYIQTRPDTKFGAEDRKYKGVGEAMLIMADKLSKDRKIVLNAIKKYARFYIKHGYKITGIGKDCFRMVLEKFRISV